MKQKGGLLFLLLILILLPCGAEEKPLYFGGSLSFTFGDLDASTKPGPRFGTDNTGSVGDISLYLRNRKVQAGVSLSLAQSAENVTSIGGLEEVPFPLSNAYIRCTDVFDLFRVKLHLRGEETALGTMAVTGTDPDPVEGELDYQTNDGVLTLELERGVLGDFILGIETNQIAGRSATQSLEALDNIWGFKLMTGYEGEFLYANLDLAVLNAQYPSETFTALWEGGGTLIEDWDLNLTTEATLVGLKSESMALGGGAEIEVALGGFTPKFGFFAKNEFYGKDEDLLSIADARDDFNTRTGSREWGWDMEVSYNPADIMGLNLITLKGGYNALLSGVQRWGWNAGFDLNFYDFDELPLTGGFSISQYGDEGLGIFGNSDLLWNAFLSFNYYGLELKAEAGRQIYQDPMDPSGGSRNSAVGYTLSALVYF